MKKILLAFIGFSLFLFSQLASAGSYVPLTFTADFGNISKAAATVQSNGWGLFIVVIATFTVVRLFKKGLSQAS